MKNNTLSPLHVFLFSFILIVQFSCSKDSDLLTDYVIQDTSAKNQLVIDDTFFIASTGSVTLDVLANDTFENEEEVMITETSTPTNGTVEINTDNTLTYTPETTEETVDTFTYTTESVNEDESVTVETGNVTVTISEDRAPIVGDNVYYVTVSGKSNNDGASEATAWNLQHAFQVAKAGDVVYIKAGDYVRDSQMYPANNGTAGNPIRFIGYKTTPGDIFSTNGATITYAGYKANGNTLDPSEMPLIRRSSVQLANQDFTRYGIVLSGRSYIELENIQFKWQQEGVIGFQHGAGIKLRNLVFAWMGNFDPNDSWNGGPNPFDPPVPSEATASFGINQRGQGISVNGAVGALIENCNVFNAGHIGILVGTITAHPATQNATIRGCKVYSDQNINPCDYYIEFYNVQNSIIENSEAYRLGDLTHQGHGIDLKRNCANNTVRNCYIENTYLELTLGSNNNLIENTSINSLGNYLYNYLNGGIKMYAGAHNNTLKNVELLNTNGILFADVWDEDNTPTNAGHDNIFIECVVRNSELYSTINTFSPISFESNISLENHPAGNYNATPAYNNKFYNCTFDGSEALFTVNRPNSGNELIDCNISNIPLLYSGRSWGDALNMTYTNCSFINSAIPD